MTTWVLATVMMVAAWIVVAGIPGAPVKGANRWIFAGGGLAIILGYILLSQGPASNPASLTWAPIFLVAGYCVIIPIALLRRQKAAGDESSE